MKVELVAKTPKKDIVGIKFGRLTAISWLGLKPIGNQGRFRSWWRCLCDCGRETDVLQTSLSSGNTKSCGCGIKDGRSKSYKGAYYSVVSNLLNSYKQTAKNKGNSFELSREEFEGLIKGKCYYCGVNNSCERFSKSRIEKEPFKYNGIDRVDNNRGYTIDNVVTCCKTCNFMKGSKPQNEFIDWIKKVYESRKW